MQRSSHESDDSSAIPVGDEIATELPTQPSPTIPPEKVCLFMNVLLISPGNRNTTCSNEK